jgi:hypothetical protein
MFDEKVAFFKKLDIFYTDKPDKKPHSMNEVETIIQDIINAKTKRLVKSKKKP